MFEYPFISCSHKRHFQSYFKVFKSEDDFRQGGWIKPIICPVSPSTRVFLKHPIYPLGIQGRMELCFEAYFGFPLFTVINIFNRKSHICDLLITCVSVWLGLRELAFAWDFSTAGLGFQSSSHVWRNSLMAILRVFPDEIPSMGRLASFYFSYF
jgi:hypothetical protein